DRTPAGAGCGLRTRRSLLASAPVGRVELIAQRAAGIRRRCEVDVIAMRAREEPLQQRCGCTAHDLRQIAPSVGVGDRADPGVEPRWSTAVNGFFALRQSPRA